jgi:hypothetical protein
MTALNDRRKIIRAASGIFVCQKVMRSVQNIVVVKYTNNIKLRGWYALTFR